MKPLYAIALALSAHCHAQEAPAASLILEHIQQHLPRYGILKHLERFVYVDIDDAYIHTLISFLQEEGFESPPYFGREDLIGAHITVIYPDELTCDVSHIEEYGDTIHFIPEKCSIIQPSDWQGVDAIYLVLVQAPALDRIREKYGLPMQRYPFHITLGVKPSITSPKSQVLQTESVSVME